MRRWHYPDAAPDETQHYFVLDSTPSLVWMANYGAIELHPWTSALPDVRQPTWALIDIDPGPAVGFADVLVLARLLPGGPRPSGGGGCAQGHRAARGPDLGADRRGLHVRRHPYLGGEALPGRRADGAAPRPWEWHTDRRRGLARLDYTQNAINKTLVAPFSPRPAPDAPVSTTLTWDELDDPDLAPDRWTLRTVTDRLADVGDPMAPLLGRAQTLPPL